MATFSFGGPGVQTQGLALARKAFYHLGHTLNPFCYFFLTFIPWAGLDLDPPIYASCIAGMTSVS
jgi:hypothetical protein